MTTEITDEQIEQLRTEAAQAGDMVQVALCDAALDDSDPSSDAAREKCEEAIRRARAQD